MRQNAMSEDVLQTAQDWRVLGHKVALGSVVMTWGSAPRQAGSQIAIREDGAFVGSVSGGCIEGGVIEGAQRVMHDGKPRRLAFGVSDEQAWSAGLACGGKIEIFVELLE
jgi:xanthine/CO dehydrogenase XdhC/CoxF family maturation factor